VAYKVIALLVHELPQTVGTRNQDPLLVEEAQVPYQTLVLNGVNPILRGLTKGDVLIRRN
jgi:hypothetical protein